MHGMVGTGSETFAANRAQGAVAFEVHGVDGLTRRGQLHESGSLRVRFPSPEAKGLSAVFINTAGGVAGGDRFDIDITARDGSALTVTTAAAEKIYRSHGPQAEMNISLRVGEGAHLAWLPQETILFDRAGLARRLDIDLAEGASLVLCERAVFGRAAMGETMQAGTFLDRWRVRRGGRLVFAENIRLDGDIGGKLMRPAAAKGGVAVGTVLIAPGDEALVERVRDMSSSFRSEVGISAWNGFAMARFCAQDASQLQADVMTVLAAASPSHLPRLWLQ